MSQDFHPNASPDHFWMPFTDVDDGTALWLESDYGRGDFAPVPVRYGEVLIFDGGYLGHGSVANRTDRTRVSLDMRFSLICRRRPRAWAM